MSGTGSQGGWLRGSKSLGAGVGLLVGRAWAQDVLGLVLVTLSQSHVLGSLGAKPWGPETSVSPLVAGARSWAHWLIGPRFPDWC